MDARYRWAERPTPELEPGGADEYQVLHRKMPQVRNRASAALLLPVLALCLTSCVRIGAPKDNGDATAEVQAAQLKIEDQAWALRSIFFRPDFGPEWREIRDAARKADASVSRSQTASPPPRAARSTRRRSPLNAGSPRFTRPNGAFAASNALVTTSPEQAAALYEVATTPAFTDCIAKNTVDFRANPPASTGNAESLATNVTAGDSTGTRFSVVYPSQSGDNESFVADFMVVKVDRALLALWFANPGTPTVQADEDAVVKALVARLTTLPDKDNLGATAGPATTAVATTGRPRTAGS